MTCRYLENKAYIYVIVEKKEEFLWSCLGLRLTEISAQTLAFPQHGDLAKNILIYIAAETGQEGAHKSYNIISFEMTIFLIHSHISQPNIVNKHTPAHERTNNNGFNFIVLNHVKVHYESRNFRNGLNGLPENDPS